MIWAIMGENESVVLQWAVELWSRRSMCCYYLSSPSYRQHRSRCVFCFRRSRAGRRKVDPLRRRKTRTNRKMIIERVSLEHAACFWFLHWILDATRKMNDLWDHREDRWYNTGSCMSQNSMRSRSAEQQRRRCSRGANNLANSADTRLLIKIEWSQEEFAVAKIRHNIHSHIHVR